MSARYRSPLPQSPAGLSGPAPTTASEPPDACLSTGDRAKRERNGAAAYKFVVSFSIRSISQVAASSTARRCASFDLRNVSLSKVIARL